MKSQDITVRLYCCLIIMVLFFAFPYSEELKELTVTGGLMYTAWVESEKSITCGLTIETPTAISTERYPLQVVLVIDASRQMEGAAMQNAKTCAKNILDKLLDTDMFGLITYSKYARIVSPLQPLNANNRRNAASAISRIKYDVGRNLSDGLKKGAEQFSKFKGQRSAGHHILLFTNGEATVGTTDLEQLTSLGMDLSKEYDIRISTFGYDRFYNEDFLIGLAKKTDGRAYFIEEEHMAEMTYPAEKEIKRIMETFANNVTLEIIIPSGSELKNVYAGKLEEEKIIVGKVQAGIKLPVNFDIVGRPSRRKDLEINIEYAEPVRLSPRKTRIYLDIPLSSGEAEFDEKFAPELIEYNTYRDVMETIENIRGKDKSIRVKYANEFKETVKKLEQMDVKLHSDYFTECVQRFWQLWRDIENAAIEEELLIKRIKYKFLELTYGKQ